MSILLSFLLATQGILGPTSQGTSQIGVVIPQRVDVPSFKAPFYVPNEFPITMVFTLNKGVGIYIPAL